MDICHEVGEHLRVGGRGYAVAEVDHVRGGGVAFCEHFVYVCVEVFVACGEQCRVDVALQGTAPLSRVFAAESGRR